jgi:hypothetical protein
MLLQEGRDEPGVLVQVEGDELNVGAILVLVDEFL